MKKIVAFLLAAVLCLQPLSGISVSAASGNDGLPAVVSEATGTVYYVDSETGSDDNAGTDMNAPWKTISKVNSVIFEAGDVILFKAGSVWTGEQLTPQGSGTEEEPITIGRYGSDTEYPVINGSAAPGSTDFSGTSNKNALYLKDVSNWVIRDLELTNYGSYNANNDSNAQKNRNGVFLEVTSGNVMKNIVLDGLYVHDVNGSNWKHNTEEGAGIRFNATCTSSSNDGTEANSSWFDGLLIQNCYIENVMRNGITQYYDYGGHPWGHNSWDQQWYDAVRSKNVVIRGNVLKDVAGDGIKLWGTDNGLVESNLVIHAGAEAAYSSSNSNLSAAVWPFDCNETVFQYNEVCYTGVQRGTEVGDGEAFDGDYYCANTLFQYNYSHNNEGGFLMLCGPEYAYSDGAVVRYNISENDGSVYAKRTIFQIGGGGGVDHSYIYNNTIYVGAEQSGYHIVHGETWDGKPQGTNFINNIFYVDGDLADFGFAGDSRDKGKEGIATYDNNLYAGSFFDVDNLPSDMPEDKNAVFGDPNFVDPGNGGDGYRSSDGTLNETALTYGPGYYAAGAYKIQEGSAAIGTGRIIDHSLLGQQLTGVSYCPGNTSQVVDKGEYFGVGDIVWSDYNGGRDFFGNKVSADTAPDIGAHQYSGSTEEKNLSELCDWLSNILDGDYEKESAAVFQAAYDTAAGLVQAGADEKEQDAAYDALENAYRNLKANKGKLSALCEQYGFIDASLYTADSYREYAYAIQFALAVNESETAKADKTAYAVERLTQAVEGLIKATDTVNYGLNSSFENTTNGFLTYWGADLVTNGTDNTISRISSKSWNSSTLRPTAGSYMGSISQPGAYEAGMEQIATGLPSGIYTLSIDVATNLYDAALADGEYAVLQIYPENGSDVREVNIPQTEAGTWGAVSVDNIRITNGKCRIRLAICSKNTSTERFLAADNLKIELVTQDIREAYKISASETTGGTITVDSKGVEGESVSFTVSEEDGYLLENVSVITENGETVECTRGEDGSYSFVMPSEKVKISAAFMSETELASLVQAAADAAAEAKARADEAKTTAEEAANAAVKAEASAQNAADDLSKTEEEVRVIQAEVNSAEYVYNTIVESGYGDAEAAAEVLADAKAALAAAEAAVKVAQTAEAEAGSAAQITREAANTTDEKAAAVQEKAMAAQAAADTASEAASNAGTDSVAAIQTVKSALAEAEEYQEEAESVKAEAISANTVASSGQTAAAASYEAAETALEIVHAQSALVGTASLSLKIYKAESETEKVKADQAATEEALRKAQAEVQDAKGALAAAEEALKKAQSDTTALDALQDELKKVKAENQKLQSNLIANEFKASAIELKAVKAKKKKVKVSWKKVSGAEGYEIQYSLRANFKGAKKITVKRSSTTKKLVTKLKSKKIYFVRIRAYRTVDGKKIYTNYSDVKKAKVK